MAMQLYNWATGNQDLEEDLNLMRNKAESLLARVADISTQVRSEELHPGKKRKREVDNWMKNAQELHNRRDGIEEEVKQGVLSNHKRLKNQIVEITGKIEELLQQGTFPNGLVIHDLGSSSLPLVTTHMTGQQFHENLRRILHWFKADKVSIIGVYGQGGVGKTTLAAHINNQLLHDLGERASVCWVTVSKDCTVSKLQDKIVKALDQPHILKEADEMRRPAILSEALKRRSNVVVILDNMWNHFPLEEVGLPIGENGCKLLLTTRSRDVCQRMECQESVRVETLSEEESWSLFVEKLGNYDKLSLEAKATAKLVAKECAGLPLGIKVVAASMRGVYDDHEWNNTLEELRNPTRIHQGMENEVFPKLQLSYSRLNDVMLQKCFLSCALYPEKWKRDWLVNHWIMEGHLEGIQSSQKQLDKAYSMLNRLVSACLLDALDSSYLTEDGVKMHDLIRDMAIRISSQRDHVMIKAGIGLQEVPRLQEWTEELTKVSLVGNYISEIPEGMTPICPTLSCLLLQNNYSLLTIPDSFLMCFNGLKLLDLSWTSIESVPNSVSDLENLSAFNLAHCHELLSVPSLAKLTKLRHLNLRCCWEIRDLPKGMEKLVNLECLCLFGCSALPPVTFNQLTLGLSNIQCLELSDCVEDAQIAYIHKLRFLERLVGCGIHGSIGNFNKYVRSKHFLQLTSYHLLLGRTSFSVINCNRAITIGGIKFEGGMEHVQLPHNIQEFVVYDCDFKVRSLADALPPSLDDCSTSLERISISRSEGIECIWSESSCVKPTLDNLKELILSWLKSFRGLAIGRVELPRGRGGAFSNLKILDVRYCNRVEKLFTPCLLNGQLQSLEEIKIVECDALEEIFELDDESGDASVEASRLNTMISVELPKLKKLCIVSLPRLVSISKTGLLCCKSVEEITVRCCPELNKLSINVDEELGNGELKIDVENLEKLYLQELNSFRDLVIGRVELPRGGGGAFSSLKILSVSCCDRMEKLYTPCLLNGQLRNLEEIVITGCSVLEEVFGGCELDDESGDATVEINTVNTIISLELPKLKILHLSRLPRLVSICKTGLLCCNSIEEIKVRGCRKLKKLPITIVDEELGNGKLKIDVEREWWESLVWDSPHHKHTLDPFVQCKR